MGLSNERILVGLLIEDGAGAEGCDGGRGGGGWT